MLLILEGLLFICLACYPLIVRASTSQFYETYSIWTFLWVLGFSSLGGLVAYISRVSRGEVKVFRLIELIGELTVSAFVGLLTFFFCKKADLDAETTAMFIGITGHMGSRAMLFFENLVERAFLARTEKVLEDKDKQDGNSKTKSTKTDKEV